MTRPDGSPRQAHISGNAAEALMPDACEHSLPGFENWAGRCAAFIAPEEGADVPGLTSGIVGDIVRKVGLDAGRTAGPRHLFFIRESRVALI